METESCQFFIDHPTTWRLEEPRVNIRGWVAEKSGKEITDIRVRLDGVVTYGIIGYDRPDIQAFMGGFPAALRSGFWIQFRAWSGARKLVIEVQRDGRDWLELFTTEVEAKHPSLPARPPEPTLRTDVVAESLYYLYRHFHYQPYAALQAEARRVIAEVTTFFTELYPENGVIGHLDMPVSWVNAHYEKFRVGGWLFHENRPISRVVSTIGILNENRLVWGKERDDVLRVNPHFPPHAKFSTLNGLVDVRPDSFSPACLKIWVEYADGGPRQLFRSKRIYLNKLDEHSGPIPVYSEWLFARTVWVLLQGALTGRYEMEDWDAFWREVKSCRKKLIADMIRMAPQPAATSPTPWQQLDPYTLWVASNQLTPRLAHYLEQEGRQLAARGPTISLVVPTYNTPPRYLDELIESVRAQYYPNWQLCFADDASPQPHVRARLASAAAQDSRIKFTVRAQNGHISAATNSALDLATGEFVGFVDHDDLLPPDALLHVAEALVAQPDTDLLYTDEDKVAEDGRRYDPNFKGAFSPEMAITHNYVHHLKVIRRGIVDRAGRLRLGYEGAQDIDLILRCVELARPGHIVHVPFVCYHWRAHEQSTAQKGDQKGYLFDAARRGIEDAIRRRNYRASAFLPPLMRDNALCLHQLKWEPALLAENPVTIVIPTKDRPALLRTCLESLDRTVDWTHVRLVVVDDGSTDPDALALLQAIESRSSARVIRTGQPDAPFNYSRLVNLGTAAATTPLVLHLNNDIEAREKGWLEDLVGWLTVPGVGVAGARLVQRDGRLDHAGIWIDRRGGLPHSQFAGLPESDFGFFFLPHAARNVSAVTGACLLTRTDLYRQLGGFDEQDFRVAYNDVDFCLRAARAGYRTVYSPQATLTHLGSASRGRSYTEREHLAFVQRYPGYVDPFLSEALEPIDTTFRVNPVDHRYARRPLGLRVVVVTHNLNLEGAPLFIFEYARHLAAQPGWSVRVVSPAEGPLRKRFEDAGLAVEILDVADALAAPDAAAFEKRLQAAAAGRSWVDVDLFVANTLVAYWVVHLARQLGKPSALYIHESNSVRRFFSEHRLAAPALIPHVEQAIRDAGRVIFTAEATRRIHEELNTRNHFRTLASWVDIERIERFAAAHDKASLRRKYGLDPDATLVVNIGTICMRKGQHIFIRAIDQLQRLHAAEFSRHGKIEYLMVGARPGLYLETIEQDIELMGLRDTRIFPETLDIYDWYRLADIFVCTSFEESFPRVLLESAAFQLPIVSTNVNGIPEMLVNNDEAHLIPAGDYFKLAATMKTALERHFAGDRKMVSMALARVTRYYDGRVSLARHVIMAREAYFT